VAGTSAGLITEWRPLDPTSPLEMVMFLAALAALIVAVRRKAVVPAAALLVTCAGSLDAMRVLPLALLVAIPVLASWATSPAILGYARSRRVMLMRGATVGLAALLVVAGLAASHLGRPYPNKYSPTIVRAIPHGCQLFNSYLLGGFVIWERPDVKVSIDSRSDLYGAKRVEQSYAALNGRDPSALAGADCVLVPPGSPVLQRLEASHEWTQIRAERTAVLLVRK
jgi:hypothetical protein